MECLFGNVGVGGVGVIKFPVKGGIAVSNGGYPVIPNIAGVKLATAIVEVWASEQL